MDINFLSDLLSGSNFAAVFFKPIAIFIGIFYFLYAVIIAKQTQVMNKTLKTESGALIFFISIFQIILAVALFMLSFSL